MRPDTSLQLLQQHIGQPWLGVPVAEKIKDMSKRPAGTRNCLVRATLDKRFRWWTMAATPFLMFYLAGLIFQVIVIQH